MTGSHVVSAVVMIPVAADSQPRTESDTPDQDCRDHGGRSL
ncbi:hypothetical protein ACLMAL_18455 [Nocardia sp. CWNU-33]